MKVARLRGTYCLKAAARCVPLLAAAGFAMATPLPTPPCGTPPVPAYASLGAQPAMAILRAEQLDTGAWRPSSCTGWPAASRSRVVVALAGLVRVADGSETLLTRAGAVSSLRTVRYWSTTDSKWRPLFLDAAALAGPAESGKRRETRKHERNKIDIPRCRRRQRPRLGNSPLRLSPIANGCSSNGRERYLDS